MTDFYYFCGNPYDLRESDTRFLYAEYTDRGRDYKNLHICAGSLEKSPFGWGEFVIYNVDPSFLTFNILKGKSIVSLKLFNRIIDDEMDHWRAKDTQLIEPYYRQKTILQLSNYPTLCSNIEEVKKARVQEMSKNLIQQLSKIKVVK